MSIKNMRLLGIVVIVALLALSWYSMLSDQKKDNDQYRSCLEIARLKAEQGLNADAGDQYLAALDMKDTLELRIEIANFLLTSEQRGQYESFCQQIVELYPEEAAGYELLTEYYRDSKNYYTCFEEIRTAQRLKIQSDVLTQIENDLAYAYELTVSYADVGLFSAGLCAVQRDTGSWGYIDPYGTRRISFDFNRAGAFSGLGLAAVQNYSGDYQLIDTTGRPKAADAENRGIEDCTDFASGSIALKYDGKYHYCDAEFREMFGAYDAAGTFYLDAAAVCDGGRWYIINGAGERRSENSYDDIRMDDKGLAFWNDAAFALKNGKYILIDSDGNRIGTDEWDDADAFNGPWPAAVKKNGRWGFVDAQGELVCDYKFAGAHSFSNGFAAVSDEAFAWGYIDDESFEVKIDCEFSDARDFNDCGSAFVQTGDYYMLLKIYRLSREK